MLLPSSDSPFGITHPLGLPRPIDPDNFFGAKLAFFIRNVMPVPTGCLSHFDGAVYRPYTHSLVALLEGFEFGWSGPAIIDEPPRYCLLRDGAPAIVPPDFRALLPDPPRISLASILAYFDRNHAKAAPLQLLDVLTLLDEDLGRTKFSAVTATHPWVAEFMR